MSGPIPSSLPLDDFIAIYESLGYVLARIEGSHYIFTKLGERNRIVTVHNKRPDPGAVHELVKLLRKGG
jgi:predicted RNA binding protein YcfA (HicA-like mRNA interferase family)